MIKKAFSILSDRYLLTTVVFFLWVLFFDQNNLLTQYEYFKELKKITDEKNYYEKELMQVKKSLQQLSTNPENLERFAREKYFMKKDNEDIFILYNKDKKKIEDEF